VPSTGFFEWQRNRNGSGKIYPDPTPWHIRLKSGEPFCFAGLWDKWLSGDREIINSFTIITTSPNALMERIHNRMPVILQREDEPRWISQHHDPSLQELLKPFPPEMMETWPVSRLVNSPKNDVPEIIAKWDDSLL
jgi:putative SOS response-associated peptidase YedK